MKEEIKAIKRLEEITKDYSLNSEDLHYAKILYYLIINLQQENKSLQSQLKAKEEAENTFKEWLEDNWKQSQDIWFVKVINKYNEILFKGENK